MCGGVVYDWVFSGIGDLADDVFRVLLCMLRVMDEVFCSTSFVIASLSVFIICM